jgi:hypothetical protein
MDTADHDPPLLSAGHDLEYWASRDFLSPTTRESLRRAAIIVVPHERFRDHAAPVFPTGTAELFRMLQKQAPTGMGVEIAIEESEYREVTLHYDVVRLATILVKFVVAPTVVGLLVEHLKKKLGSRFFEAEVEASLVVEREDSNGRMAFQFDYKGPATAYETTIKSGLANMINPERAKQLGHTTDDDL